MARLISQMPFVLLSAIIACAGAYMRRGLNTDFAAIAGLFVLAAYFQLAPLASEARGKGVGPGTALALAIFFLAALLPFPFGWVALAGAAVFSARIVWRERGPKVPGNPLVAWSVTLAALAVFAALIIANAWGQGYLSPTLGEATLLGKLNRDSLLHISHSALIKNFLAFGAGFHGTTPMKYHYGSHVFMGAMARILGTGTDFAYAFGFPIVVLPAMMSALYLLATRAAGRISDEARLGVLAILAILITGFVPHEMADRWMAWRSYFLSESYATALWLLFVCMSCLLERRLAAVPLLLGWICFTKVSVGYVGIAILGVHCLMFRRQGELVPWGTIVASTVTCWAAKSAGLGKSLAFAAGGVVALRLDGRYFKFFAVHFLPFWLMGAAFLLWLKFHRPGRMPGSLVFLAGSATAAFAAILPLVLLVDIRDQIYYFTNVVSWLALPAIAWIAVQAGSASPGYKIFAAGVALALAGPNLSATFAHAMRLIAIVPTASEPASVISTYVQALRQARQEFSRDLPVYVAPGEKRFWDFYTDQFGRCQLAPLLLIAESQRPLLFGLQYPRTASDPGCTGTEDLEIGVRADPDYWKRFGHLVSSPEAGAKVLCSEARRFGWSGYVALEWDVNANGARAVVRECG